MWCGWMKTASRAVWTTARSRRSCSRPSRSTSRKPTRASSSWSGAHDGRARTRTRVAARCHAIRGRRPNRRVLGQWRVADGYLTTQRRAGCGSRARQRLRRLHRRTVRLSRLRDRPLLGCDVRRVRDLVVRGCLLQGQHGRRELHTGHGLHLRGGQSVYNLGAAGVANAYGIYIANQTGASSTNLGIRSDAQVWINNTLSIGSQMPVSQVGLNLVVNLSGIGVSGVGADQVCQKIVGVFSSAAGSGMGLYFQPTSGSSNTFSSIWAFYIDGSNLGTSPCTNYYGLYVRNQARAQTTNSYGVYIENQSGSPTTNMGLYNAGHSQLMGYVGVNVNPVGITGNPQMVISGVNGTGAPYVPNLQLSNTANATGAAAFLRFTTGSGYSTGIACIQNQWWHAFTDSTGAPAWGYDGSRVRFAGDTGWTTPAFLNGYTAYSAPYATGYRKFVDGRVQLRGLVNAPASAGTSAFQLPAGYRPAANMTYLFTQITSFGIIRVDVQSDGNVVCGIEVRVGTWANGGWISLDGCIFLAEQ